MSCIRSIAAVVFSVGMIFIAELLGEKEIIFPEILAILTGAWISEKQPWNVNKIQLVLCMTISAISGIVIVRFFDAHLIFRTITGFLITVLILIISKTTFFPVISACILPIFLGTSSIVYPVSVFIMCLLIVFVQKILEKLKLRNTETYTANNFSYKKELKHYTKLIVVFLILSLYPLLSGNIYFIAPPLIVTFAEFSNPNSKPRKNPIKILLLLTSGSLFGTVARLLFYEHFLFPLWLSAGVAVLCLLISFRLTKTLFPPAGALTLLPMILPAEGLMTYPVKILIGASVLIIADLLLFKNKKASD